MHAGAVSAQGRDLTIAVQQVPANPILTGDAVAYDVTLTNTGIQPSPAAVRITLPAGFAQARGTPNVGSKFTCTLPSPLVVSCTRREDLVGPDRVRITAFVPRTLGSGGGVLPTAADDFTITAQADPENAAHESDELNNTRTVTTRVETAADLDVDLEGSSTIGRVGGEITYILRLRNTGDRGTAVVTVDATLPQQVAFLRIEPIAGEQFAFNACARDGQVITCRPTSTAPGQTLAARIVGRVTNSASDGSQVLFGATADRSNSIREHNENNNSASVLTTIRSLSDLRISGTVTKAASPGSPSGTVVTLRLTVTNDGPSGSSPTRIRITWPREFANSGDLQCPVGTRLQNGSCVEPGYSNCFDSCPVNAVLPGFSQVVTTFAIAANPPFLQSRSLVITAEVDPDGTVFEIDNGNNIVTLTVQIP